jgi:hypothetical protein
MSDTHINDRELLKALQEFRNKYPAITSADMQTFILGWQAAEKFYKKPSNNITKQ